MLLFLAYDASYIRSISKFDEPWICDSQAQRLRHIFPYAQYDMNFPRTSTLDVDFLHTNL